MDEISQSFQDIDVSNVDPPPLLRQRSDFHFLLQTTEWEFWISTILIQIAVQFSPFLEWVPISFLVWVGKRVSVSVQNVNPNFFRLDNYFLSSIELYLVIQKAINCLFEVIWYAYHWGYYRNVMYVMLVTVIWRASVETERPSAYNPFCPYQFPHYQPKHSGSVAREGFILQFYKTRYKGESADERT